MVIGHLRVRRTNVQGQCPELETDEVALDLLERLDHRLCGRQPTATG